MPGNRDWLGDVIHKLLLYSAIYATYCLLRASPTVEEAYCLKLSWNLLATHPAYTVGLSGDEGRERS